MTDKMKYNLTELIEKLTHLVGDIEVEFIKTLGDAGITAKQLDYLEEIERLGHPNFSELAQDLGLSKPSVTAIVEKFITQGYVERVKSDQDRRTSHIHLTERGSDLLKTHVEAHSRIADIFTKNLDKKDLDALVVILNRVVSGK